MALTVEVLKANSVLAGLSDEQLAAITTLSANDENSVIAQKTGKIYPRRACDEGEVRA